MIAYFDTSAVVPLLVDEPSSVACRQLWSDADDVVCCRLVYVEASAALAQAKRLGRISERGRRSARGLLDGLWRQTQIAEVDQPCVQRAADLADRFGLRGHDALHCASAELLISDDLVAASGDRRLLDAWHELGIATFDTNA